MTTLEEIAPKIRALEAMPTVPAIIHPLGAMLQLPPDRVDINKVLELVSYDEAIAAQCLRMANSPLFGRRNTETVKDALLVLGLKRVEAILLGCSLNRILPGDKSGLDPVIFWRHSLACAMVSRKMAQLVRYPDPEKAYLAGLLHDMGILVNTMTCAEESRACLDSAIRLQAPIDRCEQQQLGFTHCESGSILAQQWHFSPDVISAIEFHHKVHTATKAQALVSLIHLSDLLCRLRNLGYGYYEAMAVDLATDAAWAMLLKEYPTLRNMDVVRLTLDIDAAMEEITAVVDAVFRA